MRPNIKIMKKGYAAFAVIKAPTQENSKESIVLVRIPGNKLKLPGGTSEEGEIPEDTIIRELKEEIGANLTEKDLSLEIMELDKGTHDFIVFQIILDQMPSLARNGEVNKDTGKSKETTRIYSIGYLKSNWLKISKRMLNKWHRQALQKVLGIK